MSGALALSRGVSFIDMLVRMATANMVYWWTGWSPVLHVRTSGTLESGASYSYQVAVDILGSGTFEDMYIETSADDELSDVQIERMGQKGIFDFLRSGFCPETSLAFSASVNTFTIDALLNKFTGLPTPLQLVLLGILLASYTTVMLLCLQMLADGILSHWLDPSVTVYTLVYLAGMLMMQGYWNWCKMTTI